MRINSLIQSNVNVESIENISKEKDPLLEESLNDVELENDQLVQYKEKNIEPLLASEEIINNMKERQESNIKILNNETNQVDLIKENMMKELAVLENIAGLLGIKRTSEPASKELYRKLQISLSPITCNDIHMESFSNIYTDHEVMKKLYQTHVEGFKELAEKMSTTTKEGIKTFYGYAIKYISNIFNNLENYKQSIFDYRDKYYPNNSKTYNLKELPTHNEVNPVNILLDCKNRHDLVNNAIAILELDFSSDVSDSLKKLKPLSFKSAHLENNSPFIMITSRGACNTKGEEYVENINIQLSSPQEVVKLLVDLSFEAFTIIASCKQLPKIKNTLEENLKKFSNGENVMFSDDDSLTPSKQIANIMTIIKAIANLPKTYLNTIKLLDSILEEK